MKLQLRLGVHGRARTHATLPLVAQHYAAVQQRMDSHKTKLHGAVVPPAELVRSPNPIDTAREGLRERAGLDARIG